MSEEGQKGDITESLTAGHHINLAATGEAFAKNSKEVTPTPPGQDDEYYETEALSYPAEIAELDEPDNI